MANRLDMVDHINRLRDHLHLLALAALALDDADNANALHLGISEAKNVADELKAMLEDKARSPVTSSEQADD